MQCLFANHTKYCTDQPVAVVWTDEANMMIHETTHIMILAAMAREDGAPAEPVDGPAAAASKPLPLSDSALSGTTEGADGADLPVTPSK